MIFQIHDAILLLNLHTLSPMNRFFLPILFLCAFSPFTLFAQGNKGKVAGAIQSSDARPLHYATVYLASDSTASKVFANTVTDSKGKYQLEATEGVYTLGVSYLGYAPHYQQVEIKAGGSVDIEPITLVETSQELQTVVVQGKAMNVRTQPDGFSVDVTRLRQKSNDALDLLRQLPNVQVKGDNLSVVGKEHVVVKIGNVLQRVSEGELSEVLKRYDANLIQRVEVLTQPPLKYDPDGNTAMIILHTSSVFREYMGGNVGTEFMYAPFHNYRYAGFASLLYNRSKLFWTLGGYGNEVGTGHQEDVSYHYQDKTYRVTTPSYGPTNHAGGNATVQYQYSPRGHVGLMGRYDWMRHSVLEESHEETLPKTLGIPEVFGRNDYRYRGPQLSSNAYWEHGFGRANTVWLEASYFYKQESTNIDYAGRHAAALPSFFSFEDRDRIATSGIGLNHDYSFSLDTADRYKLDFGVKGLWSNTANDRSHGQIHRADPNETFNQQNAVVMRELVVSPYISATLRFSDRVWMRVGLRTTTVGNALTQRGLPDNPLRFRTEWLPSLHTAYTFPGDHKLSFTINSSIEQPKFSSLNPFEWRVNRQTILLGNPNLHPSTAYSYRLGYSWRGRWTVSANVWQQFGLISTVATFKDGMVYQQTQNAQDGLYVGGRASYYYDGLSWMEVTLAGSYGYTRYWGTIPNLPRVVEGRQWGVSASFDFTFNSSRTLSGYLYTEYVGRRYKATGSIDPTYSIQPGIYWSLFKRRLSISLAGMGLIAPRFKGESKREGYTIVYNNRYDFPTVYLSVRYRFSNGKDQTTRREMTTREVEMRY